MFHQNGDWKKVLHYLQEIKKICQILLMSLSKTVWILGLYSCKHYGIINLKIYI